MKIQLYNEEGNLIYCGYLHDKDLYDLIHNKKFNLEYGKNSNIIFIYIVENKEDIWF